MISSFFKTPRSKRFNFTPRYYDADKEAFKERYAQIEAEVNGKTSFKGSLIGLGLRNRWESNKKTTSFSKKSNLRLFIIFAVLCALCYYILFF